MGKKDLILLPVIMFSALLLTCNRKKIIEFDGVKITDLTIPPNSVADNISSIASDLRYIPVSLPGNVSVPVYKIIFCQDCFYINSGNNIHRFNNSGRFLNSLFSGASGSAGFINDFDLSTDEKTLAVLHNGKISFFEVANTNNSFVNSFTDIRLPPGKISFLPGTDKLLISFVRRISNIRFENLIVNRWGDTLYNKVQRYSNAIPYMQEDDLVHYKWRDTVFFKQEYSDTVFFADARTDTLKPYFICGSGGRGSYNWFISSDKPAGRKIENYYSVDNIAETAGYKCFCYTIHYPHANYSLKQKLLIEKHTGNRINIAVTGTMTDDICGGPAFEPFFTSDGVLYSWIYGFQLKHYLESKEFEKSVVIDIGKKESLVNLKDSLSMTGSVIITTGTIY